jgi:hypothetical protein
MTLDRHSPERKLYDSILIFRYFIPPLIAKILNFLCHCHQLYRAAFCSSCFFVMLLSKLLPTAAKLKLCSKCILIAQVAELLPVEVLAMVDTVWKETCLLYLQLEKHVIHTPEGTV